MTMHVLQSSCPDTGRARYNGVCVPECVAVLLATEIAAQTVED